MKPSTACSGPCSITTTFAPPSASSAATTAPPAPAPTTHASAWSVAALTASRTPGSGSPPALRAAQFAAPGDDGFGIPSERARHLRVVVDAHRGQAIDQLPPGAEYREQRAAPWPADEREGRSECDALGRRSRGYELGERSRAQRAILRSWASASSPIACAAPAPSRVPIAAAVALYSGASSSRSATTRANADTFDR